MSTQNSVVSKGHVEVYRTSVNELLQFHQLKRNFNHFDKFYFKVQKIPRFSIHECNAHHCFLSISSLTSWDVTLDKSSMAVRFELVIRPFCITILYHNLLLFIDIFHI
jgi:hypothetical protein